LIYQFQPHAFSFPSTDVLTSGLPTDGQQPVFPVLAYFSLITLTTIGYGDITPLTMKARYAASPKGSPASSTWLSWSRVWWECR
jgi:hypothetical protein